ncbi:hypothetical protein V8F20_005369 [Naviculisporaceae sp. PSN 640]
MSTFASTGKRLSAFKARTCPTLNFNPLSLPPNAIKVAVVILGTAYNIPITILRSHNPSFYPEKGTIVRAIFTVVYFFFSPWLVTWIGGIKGRRRVLGFGVGKKQVETYLLSWR